MVWRLQTLVRLTVLANMCLAKHRCSRRPTYTRIPPILPVTEGMAGYCAVSTSPTSAQRSDSVVQAGRRVRALHIGKPYQTQYSRCVPPSVHAVVSCALCRLAMMLPDRRLLAALRTEVPCPHTERILIVGSPVCASVIQLCKADCVNLNRLSHLNA